MTIKFCSTCGFWVFWLNGFLEALEAILPPFLVDIRELVPELSYFWILRAPLLVLVALVLFDLWEFWDWQYSAILRLIGRPKAGTTSLYWGFAEICPWFYSLQFVSWILCPVYDARFLLTLLRMDVSSNFLVADWTLNPKYEVLLGVSDPSLSSHAVFWSIPE